MSDVVTDYVVCVREATADDAAALVEDMRPADAAEVAASAGLHPWRVVHESIRMSTEAWAVYVGDELLAIYGVVATGRALMAPRTGVVWMLTTNAVERHKRVVWMLSQEVLWELLHRWDVLSNAIDCRHTKAIRWAERLGFRLEEPAPFGAAKLPFRAFEVTREDLHV